jgi:hypothetical protein
MEGEKKTRILLYSWLPTRTYHKSRVIWIFFPLKSGEFGSYANPQLQIIMQWTVLGTGYYAHHLAAHSAIWACPDSLQAPHQAQSPVPHTLHYI